MNFDPKTIIIEYLINKVVTITTGYPYYWTPLSVGAWAAFWSDDAGENNSIRCA